MANDLIDAPAYDTIRTEIVELLTAARATSIRTVNALMTATYGEIGRRIVEFEQTGEKRAGYGEELITQLATDLTRRFWSRIWRCEPEPDEPVLHRMAASANVSDNVLKITCSIRAGNEVSAALVGLRPPPLRQESRCTCIL